MSNRIDGSKTDTGRDQKGRFAPGNGGGPGRPPRQTERAYLKAMSEACTVEDFSAIVRSAVSLAKAGDVHARSWLGQYLLGRPETAADSLHKIAVAEESGADDVAEDAFLKRLTTRY